MKTAIKLMFFALVLLIPVNSQEKQYNYKRREKVMPMQVINPQDAVILAFILAESGGNPWAYNKKENARGVLQIRPIMIKEVNRIAGYEKWKHKDAWNPEKSVMIFKEKQAHDNYFMNLKKACVVWNGKGKPKQRNKYYKNIVKNLHN
jgi:hypothetical protein